MMFWYGSNLAFWQVALMWAGMIAFWVFVIWLVYYFVISAIRDSRGHDHGDPAKRILDQRLAKGEIDVEEYQRLREAISGGDRTSMGAGAGR